MLFYDLRFSLFFVPVLVIHYLLCHFGRREMKNFFLLLASLFFYYTFDLKFLFVLFYVIVINYVSIFLLARKKNKRKKILFFDIVLSLAPLIYFKYTNFIINDVLGVKEQVFGKIILPVGISFFIFQTLSYSIDVYREKENECPSFVDFALYTSFFPTILSGPIERARTLMPQIKTAQVFSFQNLLSGFQLFLWGLFEKIVVADRLSKYVDCIYSDPCIYGTSSILLATIFYGVQIYCDFAGYSNMAIGVGRMLGFEISKNFNFPYFSTTIRSFWRKWHMSLTSWFTEYVYISLGGNRVKESRWIANILIVFLLSGLWHGAAWTFVIWGSIHGFYQIIEHYVVKKKEFSTWWEKMLSWLFMFLIVNFAWMFFRADNIENLWTLIRSLQNISIPLFTYYATQWIFMWGVLLVFLLFEVLMYKRYICVIEMTDSPFSVINLTFLITCMLMVSLFGTNGASFVYFQF